MSASTPESQALALLQAGRLAEAESAFRAILARHPADAAALNCLGCILAQTGREPEGLALIDRSLELAPRNAGFLNNRARVHADAGRLEDAVADLRRASQADPRFSPAAFHLGAALASLGRNDEAIAAFRRALSMEPRNADAHMRLALVLQAAGRLDEAIAHYAHALDARPAFPEALVNWGNALKDRGDLAGATALYDRALAQRPEFLEALQNSAGAWLDRGNLAEARARYERAARLVPGSANARYGLGQVALREGRFAQGWLDYERRFDTQPPQASQRALPRALPRLTLEGIAQARRVAIVSEQGVGDQVLFSTLLPELVQRGVTAVVEVDPRLVDAYRRSVPGVEFTTPQLGAVAFATCDTQVPLGSLPGLLRPDAASFARQPRALLVPDAKRVEETRAKLGPGRWLAISWRSLQKGERSALAERKSIPLERFAALAQATGARLLDLQYGDVEAERREFHARHPGVLARLEGLDTFNDLEGVLAALAACAGVVTASNATAHLAGAIGAPASLLYLRGWPPFHYWARPGAAERGIRPDCARSFWYPSVELPEAAWPGWEAAFEALARRWG